MHLRTIQPDGWASPRGYNNGVLVEGASRMLFVAGQVAWDAEQRLVGEGDFVAQFRQALANVAEVVRKAGGSPEHVTNLTLFIKDKESYLSSQKELGGVYREIFGRHYPAMAAIQVVDFVEEGALLEIQAIAAIGTAAEGTEGRDD